MTTKTATPESVGIKELKAHLSDYVDRIREGERFVVPRLIAPETDAPTSGSSGPAKLILTTRAPALAASSRAVRIRQLVP